MSKLFQILLILLFLLQGTNVVNVLVLFLLLLLCAAVILIRKGRVLLPPYYLLAVAVYLIYLSIGIFNFHENPFIDIKFQIFYFLFFFFLMNQRFEIDFLKILFIANILTFIIYGLLYVGAIPNIWHESTIGVGGRMQGPPITAIIFIVFYYLLFKIPFDLRLLKAGVLALLYMVLNTNFMNMTIFAVLLLLLFINFKKMFKPVYIIGFSIIFLTGLWYLNSPFVPKLVAAKMQYITRPSEYPSLKTRKEDLQKALDNANFSPIKKAFGEGYGASTSIYRENKIARSLSGTFTFQEIDNGFYYLYHRGGWSLLLVFLISHLCLLSMINLVKAKAGFIVIVLLTNILSIHYFDYYFYLLIPFFIIYGNEIKGQLEREV